MLLLTAVAACYVNTFWISLTDTSMIYRFKLVSDEVNNFYRVIDIESDSTFFQLRNAILDSVGYSKDNIDSFAICTDQWEKKEEIMLEMPDSNSSDRDIYLMDDTPVDELIEEEGQKLVFFFDNLNERAFFMELKEILTGRHLAEPVCSSKKGNAPKQNSELDLDVLSVPSPKTKAAGDDFDDFDLGSYENGYDDEDMSGLSDDVSF